MKRIGEKLEGPLHKKQKLENPTDIWIERMQKKWHDRIALCDSKLKKTNFLRDQACEVIYDGRNLSLLTSLLDFCDDHNMRMKVLEQCVEFSFERQYKILEYLISLGADINFKDIYGKTLLMDDPISDGKELSGKYLEYFVSLGADINAKDNNGKTALIYAIEWLIDLYTPPEDEDLDTDPAIEFIENLLAMGADTNARDNIDGTVYNSISKAPMDIVQVLVNMMELARKIDFAVDNNFLRAQFFEKDFPNVIKRMKSLLRIQGAKGNLQNAIENIETSELSTKLKEDLKKIYLKIRDDFNLGSQEIFYLINPESSPASLSILIDAKINGNFACEVNESVGKLLEFYNATESGLDTAKIASLLESPEVCDIEIVELLKWEIYHANTKIIRENLARFIYEYSPTEELTNPLFETIKKFIKYTLPSEFKILITKVLEDFELLNSNPFFRFTQEKLSKVCAANDVLVKQCESHEQRYNEMKHEISSLKTLVNSLLASHPEDVMCTSTSESQLTGIVDSNACVATIDEFNSAVPAIPPVEMSMV